MPFSWVGECKSDLSALSNCKYYLYLENISYYIQFHILLNELISSDSFTGLLLFLRSLTFKYIKYLYCISHKQCPVCLIKVT